MRLIDANELIANVNGWYEFMKNVCHQPYMTLSQNDFIAKVRNTKTVEAIPVDYIRQWSQMMDLPENEMMIKDWQHARKTDNGYEM